MNKQIFKAGDKVPSHIVGGYDKAYFTVDVEVSKNDNGGYNIITSE